MTISLQILNGFNGRSINTDETVFNISLKKLVYFPVVNKFLASINYVDGKPFAVHLTTRF